MADLLVVLFFIWLGGCDCAVSVSVFRWLWRPCPRRGVWQRTGHEPTDVILVSMDVIATIAITLALENRYAD